MKKIKSVKYRVPLFYRNSFVFDELAHASHFMGIAAAHATKAHIMRSIIALFKELKNIDKYMALGLVSGLIQILEEREA